MEEHPAKAIERQREVLVSKKDAMKKLLLIGSVVAIAAVAAADMEKLERQRVPGLKALPRHDYPQKKKKGRS